MSTIDATTFCCSFCRVKGHTIKSCDSPYIIRFCSETREHARNSYLYQNENILLNHLRTYSFDTLKILYTHWNTTGSPRIRQHIWDSSSIFPEFPSVLSYSGMIALNMWLYLYNEMHIIRFHTVMSIPNRELMRFWYNVWNGHTTWFTTQTNLYDDYPDSESMDSPTSYSLGENEKEEIIKNSPL